MLKFVLFDMDGTLLPMKMDEFVRGYYSMLFKKMYKYGYKPEALKATIWKGVDKMIANDGSKNNEEVFWDVFAGDFGKEALKDKVLFAEFYANEFDGAKVFCGYNAEANKLIKSLKERGIKVVLATNPIFPEVAIYKRMNWAGLDRNDFTYITTYENSHFCKPNKKYFEEVMSIIGAKPDECVMVGNDTVDDMGAEKADIKTFLLTDCLENWGNIDYSKYKNGNFEELKNYLMSLMEN